MGLPVGFNFLHQGENLLGLLLQELHLFEIFAMVAHYLWILNLKRRFILDKYREMALIMINFSGGWTMRLNNCFWAVALCLTISGCSTTDVIMKKQMETDSRLEQLVQGNAAANARLAELTNEVKELRKQVNANSTDLEGLKPAFREMKSALESKPSKKDAESALAAVSRIEVVNKEPAAGDKDSGVQNAYMKAFGLYSANNYPGAVEAFEGFIKTYPKSEYAGNAQYWIGECYYSQHNYPLALDAFNKLLATYPKGSKVPDAMLKIGYTYINMNEPAKTKSALQLLVDKFPNSQAAMKAKERLNRN